MTGNSLIPGAIARLPWRVLSLVIALGAFGLVVLYSAAGGHVRPWAFSQGIRFVGLLGIAIGLSRLKEDTLKQAAFPMFGVLMALLVAVELLGVVGGGSRRWLNLGFINLQPSELMKPAIVITLARFYDLLPAGEIRRWNAIWPAAAMIGVPFGLVVLQPDLGTAVMIAAGGLVVMFLAGLPLRLFIGGIALVAVAVPAAYPFLHDYQRNRIETFFDPERDPLGDGYHIIQSKIAIGSGGIMGKGFLQGTQSHLDYLPEGHTDFVFATMAEEWGLFGGLAIIIAFLMLVNWGMRVSLHAQSRFMRLTAAGLATTIFFYFAINLMMVMGLAPVVGIPLPLVSFGGSAMMTIMLSLGVLMAIARAERGGSSNNAF